MSIKRDATVASKRKPECPISRKQFREHAKSASATLRTKLSELALDGPKEFSTGSIGWGASDKITVEINGVPVKCQVTLNVTVIGSKQLPADDATPAHSAEAAQFMRNGPHEHQV